MQIQTCCVPACSAIGPRVVDAAFFRHANRMVLSHGQSSVVEIFFGVFGHHPLWMKRVLVARNRVVTWWGLDAPMRSEIMNPQKKHSYAVGDKIGPWPIFSLTESELVAGRNNKHLDFRLSVLKETDGKVTSAVISTVCTPHNIFGRVYLLLVIPFHKWGVRHLLSRAARAGRL